MRLVLSNLSLVLLLLILQNADVLPSKFSSTTGQSLAVALLINTLASRHLFRQTSASINGENCNIHPHYSAFLYHLAAQACEVWSAEAQTPSFDREDELLSGEIGLLVGNIGLLSGEIGLLGGNIGLLSSIIGLLFGEIGLLSSIIGLLFGEIGLLGGDIGLLVGNIGLLVGSISY